MRRYRDPSRIPIFFCSDQGVQEFVADQVWNIHPYSLPDFTKSARQLFQEARERFGDYRCWDLIIRVH